MGGTVSKVFCKHCICQGEPWIIITYIKINMAYLWDNYGNNNGITSYEIPESTCCETERFGMLKG